MILSMQDAARMANQLKTVPSVDLYKYQGLWFEIAAYAKWFHGDYCAKQIHYSKHGNGYNVLENRDKKNFFTGKPITIKRQLYAMKDYGNAKLKMLYFGLFMGQYWIIDLADDYSYAVVGHPNRNRLSILSRTSVMEDSIYNSVLMRVKEKGYDINKIAKIREYIQ
jgi:apolipoprotein D and lipocalin family protein